MKQTYLEYKRERDIATGKIKDKPIKVKDEIKEERKEKSRNNKKNIRKGKIDRIEKVLYKKAVNKRIIKNEKITVRIKEAPQVNPLHHSNNHFKKEYNKEKRSLFLS